MNAPISQLAVNISNDAQHLFDLDAMTPSPETIRDMITTADVIASQVDWLLRMTIVRARDHGWSWTEIGDVLGVTKQAAQQRFGHEHAP